MSTTETWKIRLNVITLDLDELRRDMATQGWELHYGSRCINDALENLDQARALIEKWEKRNKVR